MVHTFVNNTDIACLKRIWRSSIYCLSLTVWISLTVTAGCGFSLCTKSAINYNKQGTGNGHDIIPSQ